MSETLKLEFDDVVGELEALFSEISKVYVGKKN